MCDGIENETESDKWFLFEFDIDKLTTIMLRSELPPFFRYRPDGLFAWPRGTTYCIGDPDGEFVCRPAPE